MLLSVNSVNKIPVEFTVLFFFIFGIRRAGQWNTGGRCHNEVEPITNDTHLEPYPEKMRVVDSLLGEMRTPISCLNVTKMTAYRKDGHPSVYRKQKHKMSEEETRKPEKFEDCIHWCLPGIPDAWNELLYAKLVMI
uniref:Trichome birefringence-like C-terminal domain-containing protein n=1 Tax=Nymphaea colorata TaxID=210225 RepID=A0A5K1FUZ7_9MAGN